MASEYVVRLVDEIINGPILTQSFFLPTEINQIKSSLGELQKLSKKMAGINKVNHITLFHWSSLCSYQDKLSLQTRGI
jgi:hypothetical protein